MAETLIRFAAPVGDRDGRLYEAKACGRQRDDHLWEGWIEFLDRESGVVLRTSRETTQPNYADLNYWAGGLTPVYLEGALDRILRSPHPRVEEPPAPPEYDGPAAPYFR